MANRSDDFNRNNGQDLTSFPNPSDGGSAWVVPNGIGIFFDAGKIQPYQNKMNLALLECSEADGTVTILRLVHSSNVLVLFRYVDANNYLYVEFTSGSAQLKKIESGSGSNIGSSISLSTVSGDTVGVVFSGSTINVQKNGSTVGAGWSSSFQASATKHGCGFNGNAADEIDTFAFVGSGGGGGGSKLLLRLQEEGPFVGGGRAF